MKPSPRRVTDSDALKALAHPLRLSLLEILATQGPKTASEAAALVGESPSNCSWHLRKLAEHGFVREAAGAHGRNRPWEAASDGLIWGDETDGEDGEDAETSAAGDALTDMLLERELQRLRAARANRAQEPAEWRDAATVNESQIWLTAQEAAELSASMVELFLAHAERRSDPSLRPPGARLVSMVGWVVPSGPYRASDTEQGDPR